MEPGEIVHFKGKRRQYVIVSIDRFGYCGILCALSGAMPGSRPTHVPQYMLEMDSDQAAGFTGPQARWLGHKWQESRQMAIQWGERVNAECSTPY